jgi:hypothetical protein
VLSPGNAVIVEVKSAQIPMSGKATYQAQDRMVHWFIGDFRRGGSFLARGWAVTLVARFPVGSLGPVAVLGRRSSSEWQNFSLGRVAYLA